MVEELGGLLARRQSDAALGIYVHVPYCASRCGYCDFNTYTAAELGGGASQLGYAEDALAELAIARRILGPREVATVFFGGGTPTLLPAGDLVRILAGIRRLFGLRADAEVTTEANPESVDPAYFAALRAGGFTRISLGMQSASPSVLATLERSHEPGRAVTAAREAAAAGFDHVSLDLIYGTPGETDVQWRESLESAVSAGVDHVSAYALTVEPNTKMGARVGSGVLPAPDPDVAASRYELADDLLSAAGLHWYEVSNFARGGGECRHNLGYWRGADWWGIGPGAHSHVDGIRWWNVKHPRTYAQRLRTDTEARAAPPAAGWEVLTDSERALERWMLGVRLRAGLPREAIEPRVLAGLVDDGLLDVTAEAGTRGTSSGRATLTRRGRLLADAVTLRLAG